MYINYKNDRQELQFSCEKDKEVISSFRLMLFPFKSVLSFTAIFRYRILLIIIMLDMFKFNYLYFK